MTGAHSTHHHSPPLARSMRSCIVVLGLALFTFSACRQCTRVCYWCSAVEQTRKPSGAAAGPPACGACHAWPCTMHLVQACKGAACVLTPRYGRAMQLLLCFPRCVACSRVHLGPLQLRQPGAGRPVRAAHVAAVCARRLRAKRRARPKPTAGCDQGRVGSAVQT